MMALSDVHGQDLSFDVLSFCLYINPFNSLKKLTINFSLQHPFTIQQTGKENTQMYQVEVVFLI